MEGGQISNDVETGKSCILCKIGVYFSFKFAAFLINLFLQSCICICLQFSINIFYKFGTFGGLLNHLKKLQSNHLSNPQRRLFS